MGIFRKRHQPEPDIELEERLQGYSANLPPSSSHSMVETVICWRCHRPNIYDGRYNRPKSCTWCRAQV